MSISFDSEEIILEKLRGRLRRMTDKELIEFGKNVRKLAENPFQRQLDEARAEWKRRKKRPVLAGKTSLYAESDVQKFP